MSLIVECTLTLSICLHLATEMFVSSKQSPNPMAGMRQQRRVAAVMVVIFLILFCFWYFNVPFTATNRSTYSDGQTQSTKSQRCSTRLQSKDIRQYENNALALSHVWYARNCLKTLGKGLGIENLADVVVRWKSQQDPHCKTMYKVFNDIYLVRKRSTKVVISDSFALKVKSWFKGNEALFKETKLQYITSVDNRYTQEATVFNPLRGKRPGAGGGGPEIKKFVEKQIEDSRKTCDFCNYKQNTAQDVFGYIESEYSVAISNTFKLEKFHGMVIYKHHNPLQFTLEQFLDQFKVAKKWFAKGRETDKDYSFPHIYWDIMPKASASQVHPHFHMALASGRYYAKWARLHAAAADYAADHGGDNYFTDLVKVHTALGLSATVGKATVMAYLTPQGSNEVVLICRDASDDIFELLYYTLRAFIDDMELYAMSAGMVWPILDVPAVGGDLPMLIRLVFRGPASALRADVSSIELFGTPNVNVDPYKVIQAVRNSITKRRKS